VPPRKKKEYRRFQCHGRKDDHHPRGKVINPWNVPLKRWFISSNSPDCENWRRWIQAGMPTIYIDSSNKFVARTNHDQIVLSDFTAAIFIFEYLLQLDPRIFWNFRSEGTFSGRAKPLMETQPKSESLFDCNEIWKNAVTYWAHADDLKHLSNVLSEGPYKVNYREWRHLNGEWSSSPEKWSRYIGFVARADLRRISERNSHYMIHSVASGLTPCLNDISEQLPWISGWVSLRSQSIAPGNNNLIFPYCMEDDVLQWPLDMK
jgi:hypothetical protein